MLEISLPVRSEGTQQGRLLQHAVTLPAVQQVFIRAGRHQQALGQFAVGIGRAEGEGADAPVADQFKVIAQGLALRADALLQGRPVGKKRQRALVQRQGALQGVLDVGRRVVALVAQLYVQPVLLGMVILFFPDRHCFGRVVIGSLIPVGRILLVVQGGELKAEVACG